jgi:hypothetical protein
MSILVAGEGLVFHHRLIIRDRTAGVRFREAASASDIGSGTAVLAKLDWKAALGYLNVNSRASFKTRDYDLRSLLLRIDKIES